MPYKRKHWGEFEDNLDDQLAYMPKVNFNSLIELALQPNCDGEILGQVNNVNLPVENLSLHTVRLVEHNRQVVTALTTGEAPPSPPPGPYINYQIDNKTKLDLDVKPNLNSWSQKKTKSVGSLGAAARHKALAQAAAITLASRPDVVYATQNTLDTLADAVDQFLRILTSTMRTVVDKEASSHPSGFADVMSKVFAELGITGLHKWYKESIIGSHEAAQRGFEETVPVTEVPQLHFPASLEDLDDSLGPGFQMLQTLESVQLPSIHLLETDTDNIELSDVFCDDDASPPVSPTAKKKKK